MIFYTITTFRKNISDLTKKTKDGYQIQEYMVEYSNDSLEVFDLDQSGK